MNNQQVQKNDLAGRTKLTAVTVYTSPRKSVTSFVMLVHNSEGRAIIPVSQLDQILGVGSRGSYSIG